MQNKFIIFLILSSILLFFSCEERKVYTPKPTGYFRIDLPQKEYAVFDTAFPYTFKYSTFSKIINDKDANAEPYWINIEYPKLQATIHISYKQDKNHLQQFLDDARTFAYKHTIKADAINEKFFQNPEKEVYGVYYDIQGDAASNTQFFLTDSISRFIRGALYFNTTPNKDSLKPVREYVQQDIIEFINSFEWKK